MAIALYNTETHESYSLSAPDSWPTAVWLAFERAQAERIRRTDVDTDQRRHDGNTLVHPSVSYQQALAELETARLNALGSEPGSPRDLELTAAERIAEHTGHNEYLDKALKPYG